MRIKKDVTKYSDEQFESDVALRTDFATLDSRRLSIIFGFSESIINFILLRTNYALLQSRHVAKNANRNRGIVIDIAVIESDYARRLHTPNGIAENFPSP